MDILKDQVECACYNVHLNKRRTSKGYITDKSDEGEETTFAKRLASTTPL